MLSERLSVPEIEKLEKLQQQLFIYTDTLHRLEDMSDWNSGESKAKKKPWPMPRIDLVAITTMIST